MRSPYTAPNSAEAPIAENRGAENREAENRGARRARNLSTHRTRTRS